MFSGFAVSLSQAVTLPPIESSLLLFYPSRSQADFSLPTSTRVKLSDCFRHSAGLTCGMVDSVRQYLFVAKLPLRRLLLTLRTIPAQQGSCGPIICRSDSIFP